MRKPEVFDKELQELAEFAKVISHPARLAILKYLAETKTCISGDISNKLPLSRTTVSQHLKELKNAGLIKGSIEGNSICYCIDEKALKKLQTYFDKVSEKLIKNKNNCC